MALEVCVDSVESALNAFGGGANRIELCSALCLGGLTPSLGMFKIIKKLSPPSSVIFVMIRPKPGEDYVYDEHEVAAMAEDIRMFKENKADGFVFGCLNRRKEVDAEACSKLIKAANDSPCTFHRAFDVVNHPEDSLKTVINLGFSRILTSGQEKTAYLGRHLIRKLVLKVKELNSELIIMAGGGIDLSNLKDILEETQVKEYHGSVKGESLKNNERQELVWVTDESTVRKMIEIGKSQVRNKC